MTTPTRVVATPRPPAAGSGIPRWAYVAGLVVVAATVLATVLVSRSNGTHHTVATGPTTSTITASRSTTTSTAPSTTTTAAASPTTETSPSTFVIGGTPSPTTTATTARAATTTTAAPVQDESIISPGTVEASSVYSPSTAAFRAIDGDPGSSWFDSGATDGSTARFTWTGAAPRQITRVTIVGNGANRDPSLRTGHGFESVTISIFDDAGRQVFQRSISLAGTPDPTAEVRPNVNGVRVVLAFAGAESAERSGFAELQLRGF